MDQIELFLGEEHLVVEDIVGVAVAAAEDTGLLGTEAELLAERLVAEQDACLAEVHGVASAALVHYLGS